MEDNNSICKKNSVGESPMYKALMFIAEYHKNSDTRARAQIEGIDLRVKNGDLSIKELLEMVHDEELPAQVRIAVGKHCIRHYEEIKHYDAIRDMSLDVGILNVTRADAGYAFIDELVRNGEYDDIGCISKEHKYECYTRKYAQEKLEQIADGYAKSIWPIQKPAASAGQPESQAKKVARKSKKCKK